MHEHYDVPVFFMAKLTAEQQEVEAFIRATAQQAQAWQKAITADEDLERWMNDGNWTYLRAKVLDIIERRAFQTIKNPAFDPSNLAQVAQFQAHCRAIDLIEAEINQRLATVQDARAQLQKLEIDATLNGRLEENEHGN